MGRVRRVRLDELLVARGLAATRSAARGLILAGLVSVDGVVADKAGLQVATDAPLAVQARPRFVSRAGEKLAYALSQLGVEVAGTHAVDVGASTGGFTDVLLQNGAQRVIALDVGRGQLDWRIRTDPRVFVLEKVNARCLRPDQLPFVPDMLTMDVSFISVTKLLPAVISCMTSAFKGLLLVKPQFEAGPRAVGKGGVVRDPAVHRAVLLRVARFVTERTDTSVLGLCQSGLPGSAGNREFFLYIARGGGNGLRADRLEKLVDDVVEGPCTAGVKQ